MNPTEAKELERVALFIGQKASELSFRQCTVGDATASIAAAVDELLQLARDDAGDRMFREGQKAISRAFGE